MYENQMRFAGSSYNGIMLVHQMKCSNWRNATMYVVIDLQPLTPSQNTKNKLQKYVPYILWTLSEVLENSTATKLFSTMAHKRTNTLNMSRDVFFYLLRRDIGRTNCAAPTLLNNEDCAELNSAVLAITINSNVCPHIRVPNMLMRNPMHDVIGIFNSEARY